MNDWLYKTIGLGPDMADHIEQAALSVQRPMILWIGLALLIPIAVLIFLRQRGNTLVAAPLVRMALTVTRVLIVALLIVVLAGPYLKIDQQVETRPIVAVLIDTSQSMDLPAGPFVDDEHVRDVATAAGLTLDDGAAHALARDTLNRMTRLDLATAVLTASSATLTETWTDRYDVRWYSFGERITPIAVADAPSGLPHDLRADRARTHLGDVIEQVIDEAAGRPIAGIVMFSDGEATGGSSPAEAVEHAARAGAPIYAVPAGVDTPVRDVAIRDVFTTGSLTLGDQGSVSVAIESQGFDGRSVNVQLFDGHDALASEDLVLEGRAQQQVDLTFQATRPGNRYLSLHVTPPTEEPESLRGNNSNTALVHVDDRKIRVLYLEGAARWDFRFLKNAMRRDMGLTGRDGEQIDLVLEAEWRRQEGRTDAIPESLGAFTQYDVVILGDVSPTMLSTQTLGLIVEAVQEHGLGVIIAAGPRHMPVRYAGAIDELLPVRLLDDAAGRRAADLRPFKIKLTAAGSVHAVMRQHDEAEQNDLIWSQMPGMYWCAPAERPAAGAQVLAAIDAGAPGGSAAAAPLIAVHRAGRGRVMFVGTDATWRWRRDVGERSFYRFWGQAIRYVADRDDAPDRSTLVLRPLRAQPGEPITVDLIRAGAEIGAGGDDPAVVHVSGAGEVEVLTLDADAHVAGRHSGSFTPPAPGQYRFEYEPPNGAAVIDATLNVTAAPLEMRQPNVNRAALTMLAETSGGRTVALHALGELAEQVHGEPKITRMHREATVWDNWLVLAVLMMLYSLDVGLRRLTGLS